jgi:HAMP domain-containing protein
LNLDGYVFLALAFGVTAVLGHFSTLGGVLLGLGLAWVLWMRQERQVERLRLFSQRLQSGDFSARLAFSQGRGAGGRPPCLG